MRKTLFISYLNKRTWKVLLVLFALIIVVTSFWYTNRIIHKIEKEERKEIELWATAIERRAELIKYTNELFQKLQNEERKKSELWAKGIEKLIDTKNSPQDIGFIFDVVQNNETVPVILTNEYDSILAVRNFAESIDLVKELLKVKSTREPLTIKISESKNNYVYYQDSRLFTDLRSVMNDIIESFLSENIIQSSSSEVIITDSTFSTVIKYGNIDTTIIGDQEKTVQLIQSMKNENAPILLDIGDSEKTYVLYKNSSLLNQLKYYPIVQFTAITLFVFLAYVLFSISRKSEQNQVWAGMAKETAHQLGTPLSSLMAWIEVLRDEVSDKSMLDEMDKDILRLNSITDRFSKIGSEPKLEESE
ncbi:MAG: histidine kinase dimerization/phospho-acceptor domain-containing protein, partial [Cyclobacteriaceae bacterium]